MRSAWLKIVIPFFLWGPCAYTQPLNPDKDLTQYNIDHWSGEDLPSAGIIDMYQTSEGYIWLATFNSLIRFDGVEFKTYDKFNVEVFKESGFRSLYEDRLGNFWIGGNGGGLYLKKKNGFIRFEIPFGTSGNNIKRIYEDKSGTLWLGTIRGLVSFRDSVFRLFLPPGLDRENDFSVFDIEEDDSGRLWLGTSNGVYQLRGDTVLQRPKRLSQIKGEVFDLQFSKGELWIASYDKGVVRLKSDSLIYAGLNDNFQRPIVLFEDRYKNVWIGTETGLVRFNDGDYSSLNEQAGLGHDNIASIIEDHEGSIWVATYYGGLNRLRDGAFTNYTTLHGLRDNTVHAIHQTADKVYVGTEHGISCFDGEGFTVCEGIEAAIGDRRVRDIYRDNFGRLWIATYSGLFMKSEDGVVVKYTTSEGLVSNQVRLIFEDNQGGLWAGTRAGLNLFKEGGWTTFNAKNGLTNEFVTGMLQIHSGDILIATTGGLYEMTADTIKVYNPESPLGMTLFRMYEDDQQNIWLGSNTGLHRISDKKIFSYYRDHPVLGSNIYQIIEDNNGVFWLTSDKGVIRVEKAELLKKHTGDTLKINTTIFDKSNGLRTNQVTAVARGEKLSNGNIWFPTLGGVAIINPENIKINEVPPPIVIDKVKVSGKPVDYGSTFSIPPGHKNIEIHYKGLSYMIPQKVKFRYKLDGFDEEWNNVGQRRTAYFSSLPPGTYSFSIAACNNDGVWNVKEGVLNFVVEPAFWQTPIFYFMAIVVGFLVVFGVIDYRTRSVHRLNRVLEEKIDERTSEVLNQKEEIQAQRDDIEQKNRELENARVKLQEVNETLEEKVKQRTAEVQKAYKDLVKANKELDDFVYKSSHDVKGPLARLLGLTNLALIESKGTPAQKSIEKLLYEAELANDIIQKLSYAHSIKNASVDEHNFSINDVIMEVTEEMRNRYGEAEIHFDFQLPEKIVLKSDEKLVRELLRNVIENAVIFRKGDSVTVRVQVQRVLNDVIVEVEDNGTGVSKRIRKDIFKLFVKGDQKSGRLGLGLYVAGKAAEAIGASLKLKKSGKEGSMFVMTIPIVYKT